jgi:hypothetical protein
MALQPVQSLNELAAAPTYNAANSSDTFTAAPATYYLLHVKNGSASAITVTIDDVASVSPAQATQFNPDIQFSVPATSERILKINSNRFRNTSGVITVTFSATATVTYAIYGPL